MFIKSYNKYMGGLPAYPRYPHVNIWGISIWGSEDKSLYNKIRKDTKEQIIVIILRF